jgi:hypothetical protein
MSKCKLRNPSKISPSIKIHQGYTNGLCILGVQVGSQDFATHFLDEVLSHDVVHIDDLPFLETPMLLWAFCFHVQLINLFILH